MIKRCIYSIVVFCAIFVASMFVVIDTNKPKTDLLVLPTLSEEENEQTVGIPEIEIETQYTKGFVEGAGEYPLGEYVTIKAVPNDGCYFQKWQIKVDDENYTDWLDAQGNVITASNYTFMVVADVNLKAVFEYNVYDVYYNSNFIEYYELTNLTNVIDENIFNSQIATQYPRTSLAEYTTLLDSSENGGGEFYYNDELTFTYTVRNGEYIKALTYKDVINQSVVKNKAVISVDKSNNKIISTYINGIERTDYSNETLDDIVIDLNVQDYYIFMQELSGENYITTEVIIKTKIQETTARSINFNIVPIELHEFYINVYNELSQPININEKIASLINFNFGYYGYEGVDGNQITYLVQNSINFMVSVDNNDKIYSFNYFSTLYKERIVSNTIIDVFSDSFGNYININFSERFYNVTFEQYLKDASLDVMPQNIFNLSSINILPGGHAELDFSRKTIDIYDYNNILITSLDFEYENVKGYQIYAITNNLNNLEANNFYDIIMDPNNPTSFTIYIIFTKIEYTIDFNVYDKEANESDFYKSKLISFEDTTTIKVGENITLNATARDNFQVLGWKKDLAENYLTELSFEFMPQTNDNSIHINYYVIADYKYYNINYVLGTNSFVNTGEEPPIYNPMALMYFCLIDYFTYNNIENKIAIYGKIITDDNISGTASLVYEATLGTASVFNQTYLYQTELGEITIVKNGSDYISLKHNNKLYTQTSVNDNVTTFELTFGSAKTSISSSYVLDNSTTNYQIALNNVSVDDNVLVCSYTKSVIDYVFMYYTIDHKSMLVSGSSNNFVDVENPSPDPKPITEVYVNNMVEDYTITVVYKSKTREIYVKTNEKYAYDIETANSVRGDICDFVGVGNAVLLEDVGITYLVVNAETNCRVNISIMDNKITKGYSFSKFSIKKFGDVEYTDLDFTEEGEGETKKYVCSFIMTNLYADANILINFSVITYTVNIVQDNTYKTELRYPESLDENKIEGSFVMTITDFENYETPTLFFKSPTGHYITKAYFNNDTHTIITNDDSTIIEKQFAFCENKEAFYLPGGDFNRLIMDLADENHEVTLYIELGKKSYSISINYYLDGKCVNESDSYYVKNAKTRFQNLDIAGEQNKSAVWDGATCGVSFDGIEYGTNISCTIDDSLLQGVVLGSWRDASFTELTQNPMYELSLYNDLILIANFISLDYGIEYRFVDENETLLDNVGNATTLVNSSISSVIRVGDQVYMDIAFNTGYRKSQDFVYGVYAYWKYGPNAIAKNAEGLELVANTNDVVIKSFYLNNIFLITSQEYQRECAENRIITIYIVTQKQEYVLSTSVANSTLGLADQTIAKWPNNNDMNNWIVSSIGEYNLTTGEVVTKNKFIVDTQIEVRFNNTFDGIYFTKVELGSANYYLNALGEPNVANQTIRFYKDVDQNCYVINFKLNSNLLAYCNPEGEDDVDINFILKIFYSVKKYNITFKVDNPNYNDVSVSYRVRADLSGSSNGSISLKYSEQEDLSVFYNQNIDWQVSTTGATFESFNKMYRFAYFEIEKALLHEVEYAYNGVCETSFLLKMTDTYEDKTIWEIIANKTDANILIKYLPKITLNHFESDAETKTYTKTVVYNGRQQPLTCGDLDQDIVYDSRLRDLEIYYNNAIIVAKNAGTYTILLKLGGVEVSDIKIQLIIKKKDLTLEYIGTEVSKIYDGKIDLSYENLVALKSRESYKLNGLEETDSNIFPFNFLDESFVAYYESPVASETVDVMMFGVKLSNELGLNYNLLNGDLCLDKRGRIAKAVLTVLKNNFKFPTKIVYREEKTSNPFNYTLPEQIHFLENVPENKEVGIDVNKIKISVDRYEIGEVRAINVDFSEALTGADSTNFTVLNLSYELSIHPYYLEYTLPNIGKFYIKDIDEVGVIPFNLSVTNSLTVTRIDSTNPSYSQYYNVIETTLRRDEKMSAFYTFLVVDNRGNRVPLSTFINKDGNAYMVFENVKDFKGVYQISPTEIANVDYAKTKNTINIKIAEDSNGVIAVVIAKDYFPVWKIVLIVIGIVIGLSILVVGFIIIKRKVQGKNEKYDAI